MPIKVMRLFRLGPLHLLFMKDAAYGTEGKDYILLNGGNDYYRDDYIDIDSGGLSALSVPNGGNDWIYGGLGADSIWAGSGDDHVYGEAGDDFLSGRDGNGRLYGGDGNDIMSGGPGNDFSDGGPGNDILGVQAHNFYSTGTNPSDLDPRLHYEVTPDGDSGDDTLVGGPGEDILYGGFGKDGLWGGSESDILYGGPGVDHLWGGSESDQFVFDVGNDGILSGQIDYIHDLEPRNLEITSLPYDTIVMNSSALVAAVGGTFSTQLINIIDFQTEAGVKGHFNYSDPFAGFVFDNATHDLVYDGGQETVVPLVHLNNDIDRLQVVSVTGDTITFAGVLL
jgi:Ca2+-binding RTX toxin-like protein